MNLSGDKSKREREVSNARELCKLANQRFTLRQEIEALKIQSEIAKREGVLTELRYLYANGFLDVLVYNARIKANS